MKVLFIGGTGTISAACTHQAIEKGMALTIFNRGENLVREIPDAVSVIHGDIRNVNQTRSLLSSHKFDVVVDFLSFNPDHILTMKSLFGGKVGQYVFISSASAYQKPVSNLPIRESTPLDNPFWEYSRLKAACEQTLHTLYQTDHFPFTIVRPSHTYDQTRLPFFGRYTVINRMRTGKKVIVHGDGTSLWALTHARDFAKGLIGLLGNFHALGETFHITSDELLAWNQIYGIFAAAAGTTADIIHIPSDLLAAYSQLWRENLLGDKTHTVIFDNSKIKQFVPAFQCSTTLSDGAREVLQWFDAKKERRIIDKELDYLMDIIIENYLKVFPSE